MSAVAQPPIGLLAGSGRYPLLFAEKARSLGIPVCCIGLKHEASPELAKIANTFHWAGVAQLGKMIRCMKRDGVRQAVRPARHKVVIHQPWRLFRLLPIA